MVSLNLPEAVEQESVTLPFPVRPFSVAEYESMARCHILTEDHNVELLEGLIVPKMTKNPFHETVIGELQDAFQSRLKEGFHIRIQNAITTGDSVPEPDLAIVRGKRRDYLHRHPGPQDLLLVIEVSESSLRRDRAKRRIYAKSGIPTYWIVNLQELCVEVYTDPVGDAFATAWKFEPGESVKLMLPDGTELAIPVDEFLSQD